MNPIYMDNAASTPVAPEALEAMTRCWEFDFGNPDSKHLHGLSAAKHVELGRKQVASLIGANAGELVFTSGATEANNLALRGVAASRLATDRRHVVVSAVEHPSVLEPALGLRQLGYEVDIAPVLPSGVVDLEALAELIRADTLLVSVMHANNEVGTIQPIEEIGKLAHARGAILHCDAVQALATESIEVSQLGVDLLTLSSHKMYGPKGIGALYARGPIFRRLEPILCGGGQERGRRSGTVPAPLIAGFGAAAEVARKSRTADKKRVAKLRDQLRQALEAELPLQLNGAAEPRLPGNLNVRVEGCSAGALLMSVRNELSASRGSACSAGNESKPSHVLTAMGLEERHANESLRLTLGRYTTDAEVDHAATCVLREAQRLSKLALR